MPDMDIGEFSLYMGGAASRVTDHVHEALEEAAALVARAARAEIGSYQGQVGPLVAWAELADATKDDRLKKGFTENDPLERTGDLRDSIGHEVEMQNVGLGVAIVGSTSEIARYQEMGTSRIPPRSFLAGALLRNADPVRRILGERVSWALGALRGRLPP